MEMGRSCGLDDYYYLKNLIKYDISIFIECLQKIWLHVVFGAHPVNQICRYIFGHLSTRWTQCTNKVSSSYLNMAMKTTDLKFYGKRETYTTTQSFLWAFSIPYTYTVKNATLLDNLVRLPLLVKLVYLLTGFTFETEDGPQKCRAMLMLSPDDLPSRALLTNMKNYNGESSCSTCHQKGETVLLKIHLFISSLLKFHRCFLTYCNTIYVCWLYCFISFYFKVPGNVLHRVWPFEPDCLIRTREEVLRAVREMDRTNKPVY